MLADDGTTDERHDAPDHQRLTAACDDYPELLRELRKRPDPLFVRGDVGALHLPAIAIVGSRNPTRGGIDNAYRFSRYLARAGFCIVSGLAQGIDAGAHRGALDAGGSTVAVLGHGLDRTYPAAHGELATAIAATGALVAEYPPGTPPRREHFPERNRIISGLAVGTLVVEAAQRSGSLITARLAGEQGREVFAIPGSIHNPMSRGCHELIRQGAHLVESGDDILSELGALLNHVMQNRREPERESEPTDRDGDRDGDYVKLLEALAYDPQTPDELAAKSGLTIAEVSSMLLILELDGVVESLPGGQFAKLSG